MVCNLLPAKIKRGPVPGRKVTGKLGSGQMRTLYRELEYFEKKYCATILMTFAFWLVIVHQGSHPPEILLLLLLTIIIVNVLLLVLLLVILGTVLTTVATANTATITTVIGFPRLEFDKPDWDYSRP